MAKRTKLPFWRRLSPRKKHDIALLRPSTLPKKDRFESLTDTKAESERSERVLRAIPAGQIYADLLSECRDGYYHCDYPFCPICARKFRRWFTGELLRLTEDVPSLKIITVLLKAEARNNIQSLDPAIYRDMLRKRLQRSGLRKAVVIGGFENVYNATKRAWILHVNLLVIGAKRSALDKFAGNFSGDELDRPIVESRVRDRLKQISYVLKFTTYHRPYKQSGSSKSPAVPLNAAQHMPLVKWMNNFQFQDFLFLFNARRTGPRIQV